MAAALSFHRLVELGLDAEDPPLRAGSLLT
jgi:hypothetical protein